MFFYFWLSEIKWKILWGSVKLRRGIVSHHWKWYFCLCVYKTIRMHHKKLYCVLVCSWTDGHKYIEIITWRVRKWWFLDAIELHTNWNVFLKCVDVLSANRKFKRKTKIFTLMNAECLLIFPGFRSFGKKTVFNFQNGFFFGIPKRSVMFGWMEYKISCFIWYMRSINFGN